MSSYRSYLGSDIFALTTLCLADKSCDGPYIYVSYCLSAGIKSKMSTNHVEELTARGLYHNIGLSSRTCHSIVMLNALSAT